MVAHPGAAMKRSETESKTSTQFSDGTSSSIPLTLLNFFNIPLTKSEDVIPRTDWDLTDATKVAVRSSRASTSAICSLGL
jgi:hypothetical protein